MTKARLSIVQNDAGNPSRLDWATVEQALCANGSSDDTRSTKLQRLVLDKLFEIPPADADEYITDGGDDCGIDLFYTDDNNNQIHLITTKTVEAFDKAKNNFPSSEVAKLICFVRDFVSKNQNLLTRCNPLLRAKVVQAWDSIDTGRVYQICVHICSNQSALIERDADVLRESVKEYRTMVFEHHLDTLSEKVTRNWTAPITRSLRFIGHELFEHQQTDPVTGRTLRSLAGSVKISDISFFLRDETTRFVDEGLFHANVRGHLGIHNPVNRDILDTLQGPNNSRFFCLNNGLTVVCEKYLYQSGGFPVTLNRPQIVNGRQTAEVIFQSYRQNPSATGDVVVFVRVIETSEPDLIEEISVATNSQSRIGSRDLRANSVIAKKLAAGLAQLGYQYVRKRGEKVTHSPEKTIDALKAGQLILAYARDLPEKAKTNTASMFGDDFESIFDPHQITPELLLTAHRLFSAIESEKHRAMLTMRQSGLSAASAEHWLVEGAFHVLFCLSLIARTRGVDLSNYEKCSELIGDALATVGKYFEGLEKIAAYRLFRSIRARDDLKQIVGGGEAAESLRSDQLRFGF